MTTPSKDLVAEGLGILKILATYGAWVEPVGSPGREPTDTLIGGRHLIEAREHEVAPYLLASLERVDLAWLFASARRNDPMIIFARRWARALLPPDHELHAALTVEEQTLLSHYRRGAGQGEDVTHGQ